MLYQLNSNKIYIHSFAYMVDSVILSLFSHINLDRN